MADQYIDRYIQHFAPYESVRNTYDAIEVASTFYVGGTQYSERVETPDDVHAGHTFASCTVYLHRKDGGVEAWADCATATTARAVAAMFALVYNLPVTYDMAFDPAPTPAPTGELRWYVVTGRQSGDDEDRAFVIHATSPEHAREQAKEIIADERDADPNDEDWPIYINAVADCGTDQPKILD